VIETQAAASPTSYQFSHADFFWAIGIAVFLSLLLAFIEIANRSKARLRACFGIFSFLYCLVLCVGNVVTTLFASLVAITLPSSLSSYYFLFAAFFGVFGFEIILKNTNITMFDKGVLTIQAWIEKALSAAAGAAIDKQEDYKQSEVTRLVEKLLELQENQINARVLVKMGKEAVTSLDAAARASSADRKEYKVRQLVATLSRSESAALLRANTL
jgi:hypothetical protein